MAVSNEQESWLLIVWSPVRQMSTGVFEPYASPQYMENYLQTPILKEKEKYRDYHTGSNKTNLLTFAAVTSIYFIQIGEKSSK